MGENLYNENELNNDQRFGAAQILKELIIGELVKTERPHPRFLDFLQSLARVVRDFEVAMEEDREGDGQ